MPVVTELTETSCLALFSSRPSLSAFCSRPAVRLHPMGPRYREGSRRLPRPTHGSRVFRKSPTPYLPRTYHTARRGLVDQTLNWLPYRRGSPLPSAPEFTGFVWR